MVKLSSSAAVAAVVDDVLRSGNESKGELGPLAGTLKGYDGRLCIVMLLLLAVVRPETRLEGRAISGTAPPGPPRIIPVRTMLERRRNHFVRLSSSLLWVVLDRTTGPRRLESTDAARRSFLSSADARYRPPRPFQPKDVSLARSADMRSVAGADRRRLGFLRGVLRWAARFGVSSTSSSSSLTANGKGGSSEEGVWRSKKLRLER